MNNSVSSNGWVWLVARLVLLFCFPRSAKVDCQNSWRWQLCHHTPVLPVANSAAVHPARCCAKAHLGESQRLASPFLGGGLHNQNFLLSHPSAMPYFAHFQITATPFVQLDFLVGLVVHLLDIEPGSMPLQGTAQNYILCHLFKKRMLECSEIRPELDLNAFAVGTL